jgi:DNA primase catalytic core
MKVDFDQIKRTTDLVRVVESYGITLKKSGRDYVGLCPFHDDHHPSLRVTPAKGLFRCPSCQAAGNVIQFVAKKEGLSEREAAIKLLTATPGVTVASAVKAPLPRTAPSPQAGELLQRVVTFYARTLHKDRAGFEYLKSRNLADATLLEVFQVGYCNGTLPNAVAKSGEVVESLKATGVLKVGNREHFQGYVTVPIFNEAGEVTGIYGRNVRPCEPHERHLYLPGPRRGVFNGIAARTSQTLFIAESIFDAMALWQAGFKNVIALYGTGGWTADHEKLLRENGTTEIYLCLDNDDAGRTATAQLKEKLATLIKTVHVIQWPEGVKDAGDFFLSRSPADFEALVKAANPNLGAGPACPKSEATAKAGDEKIEMTPDGFVASYASRHYEVRAVEHPSPARLKATVRAFSTDAANAGGPCGSHFHIDTVDFYLSRSRRTFISETARLFRDTVDVVEGDVNRLITQLETYANEREGKSAQSQVQLITDGDKAEGLKLGRHPDLVSEILRDLERFGLVGELTNKTIGYLVMTSRKMDDPLSLLILSGSGAGKSLLQDTLLRLCPDEDLVKLTSLTGEALFYMGQDALKNKVLALEEHAGATEADYAIRNLISAKKLVKEATIKDPLTGRLVTMRNVVDGPCAVFKTTTEPEMDAETKSRFIITSIDESPEQTKAILEAQRHSHTLEGMRRRKQREQIVRRHHAFQRLLKPLTVVNPFEPLLTYAENRLLVRRDNPKYLHLILAVTFLYQLQRPVRHDAEVGDYVETTLDDIAIANELATDLFGQSLDELSRPSRELLKLIRRMTETLRQNKQPLEISRRQVREFSGWSDYQIKIHIKQLEQLEYLIPLSGRRGQCFSYRLAWDGEGLDGERFVLGLSTVEELRQRAKVVGLKNEVVGPKTNLEGSSRVQVGLSRNGEKPDEHGAKPASSPNLEGFAGKPISVLAQPSLPILVENGVHP